MGMILNPVRRAGFKGWVGWDGMGCPSLVLSNSGLKSDPGSERSLLYTGGIVERLDVYSVYCVHVHGFSLVSGSGLLISFFGCSKILIFHVE